MDATQPTERRSAARIWTIVLLVLLLLCASAAVTACGAVSTTTSDSPSPSPSEAAASVAASPSSTSLPKGAGRGTIAFTKVTKVTEGAMDIYVVRSDGRGLRRLAADAKGPAWSPDGSKIVYTSLAARGGVWVMYADGSGKRQVTPAPGGAEWVAWSPDGRQILFSSTAFGGDETLVVVNSDGSGPKSVLTRSSGYMGYTPAWAPNGRIFLAGGAGTWARSARSDPDGRGLTVVTATARPSASRASRSRPTGSGSRSGMGGSGPPGAHAGQRPGDGGRDRRGGVAVPERARLVVLVTERQQAGAGQRLAGGWLVDGVLHIAKTDGSEVWEVPNTAGAYTTWRPE